MYKNNFQYGLQPRNIPKDCAGRVTATEYKVFDIFFARGREKEVFDAWFEKLGITPRSVTKKKERLHKLVRPLSGTSHKALSKKRVARL